MTPEYNLKATVRTIPDYPKPGVMFRDITTLLGDARAFRRAVDELVQPWAGSKIDKVAGIEARGFILGGALAHQVSAGFVPIRKRGKLPHTTVSSTGNVVCARKCVMKSSVMCASARSFTKSLRASMSSSTSSNGP